MTPEERWGGMSGEGRRSSLVTERGSVSESQVTSNRPRLPQLSCRTWFGWASVRRIARSFLVACLRWSVVAQPHFYLRKT